MPGRNRESARPAPQEKICPVCGRPFAWRSKWARDWEQVIYCSDACRRGTPRGAAVQPGSRRRK